MLITGAGQIAAICRGIRVMRGISDDCRLDAEAPDRRTGECARQARERHEEAMAALTELIHRTAAPAPSDRTVPGGLSLTTTQDNSARWRG